MIEVVDGAEGVAKARSEQPDLVLMDIQLPVLDGYDATRQIKSLPGLGATPIIAVSSLMSRSEIRPVIGRLCSRSNFSMAAVVASSNVPDALI